MATPEDLRAQIDAKREELRTLEQELIRSTVVQDLGNELQWLSSASRRMVSLIEGITEGYEITVFDYSVPQSTGKLSEEDIVSLRDFLTTHITDRLNMRETQ